MSHVDTHPGFRGHFGEASGVDAAPLARNGIDWIALGWVWLAVASGAVVFTEPAPVDILTMGLVIGLPLVGLTRVTRLLVAFVALWMVSAAFAFVASTQSIDVGASATHSAISVYLYLAAFVFAAFVALRPIAHTDLIMTAYMWGGLGAVVAGLIGYFDVVPGASQLFTKYGRAAGTFKDPNVFGAFLVPPTVYAIHLVLTRPLARILIPGAIAMLLTLGIVLSFSRGAWVNLALALVLYVYLAFVTAPTNSQRLRLTIGMLLAVGVLAIGLMFALQHPDVSEDLRQRASLTQSYDEGPEGRFGGQRKALGFVLDNPLGIGALQFAPRHNMEEPHNVYLSIFLNAGWVGGFVYWIMVGLTLFLGARHLLLAAPSRPLFIVAYASFVAVALEGIIIDSDHWRHFYLMMAIVWGIMATAGDTEDRLPNSG